MQAGLRRAGLRQKATAKLDVKYPPCRLPLASAIALAPGPGVTLARAVRNFNARSGKPVNERRRAIFPVPLPKAGRFGVLPQGRLRATKASKGCC